MVKTIATKKPPKTSGGLAAATLPKPGITVAAPPAPVKPEFTAAADDPSQAVANVISQGGPLMKLAETEGRQQANRRGLLSSTMAVGAAQDSVLRAATPIGLQAASQGFQKNISNQNFGQESYLQGQQLRAQDVQQIRDIANQQQQQKASISSTEKLANLDVSTRKYLANFDRETQIKLADMNLDAKDQELVAGMMANYQNTYESALDAINKNENLSAADRTAQMKSLQARRANYLDMISDIYNVSIEWPSARESATPAPSRTGRTSTAAARSTPATGNSNRVWSWSANGGQGGYVDRRTGRPA